MTDTATLGTIEYLDPNEIEVDPNVRIDVKLDRVFIDSIKERGVLMPVACRRREGKVSVRMGQRRVLGAREAGRIIPAYVVVGDDTTVDRLLDQFAENEHRAGLSEPERAAVFQQLAFEGLSVPQIAKKTGVKKAIVEAGITVAENAFAGKIATKHQVTLDQAAAMLEFENDQAVVDRLIACAEDSPEQFPHELQRQRDERHRAEVRAETEHTLDAQGFTVLAHTPGYYDTTPVALTELVVVKTGEAVTLDQITGLDGAAAHVRVGYDGNPEISYYLDDPKAHGFKKRPQNGAATGPMTEEQKAERRQLIANNKAWASAETVRRDWLTTFLGKRTLPKDATAFVATMLTVHPRHIGNALPDGHLLAATLLGLPEPSGYWTPSELTTFVAQHPAKAVHAALATIIGSIESTTSKNTWRHPDPADARYFAQLQTWGYPLAEVELLVIGDTATASNADDATQTEVVDA